MKNAKLSKTGDPSLLNVFPPYHLLSITAVHRNQTYTRQPESVSNPVTYRITIFLSANPLSVVTLSVQIFANRKARGGEERRGVEWSRRTASQLLCIAGRRWLAAFQYGGGAGMRWPAQRRGGERRVSRVVEALASPPRSSLSLCGSVAYCGGKRGHERGNSDS